MTIFTKNIFFIFVGGRGESREASRYILILNGTFWSLNRGSSLLGYEVIGGVAFWPFLGH